MKFGTFSFISTKFEGCVVGLQDTIFSLHAFRRSLQVPSGFMNSNTLIKAAKMYHFSERLKHGPMDLEGVNSGICFVKACIH